MGSKGRKVFIVLYRAGGAGSRLRKYTIGPYGRVTLHQARTAALRIFAARTEGRDPAAEKQQARRRLVVDRVEDLVELFITEHVSKTRSAREISRLLRREVIPSWGTRSVHEIGKRQIIELVTEVAARGTPSAANKLLKMVKAFFGWCVGRAILDISPANGLAAPARERAWDRVLEDDELARILRAARQMDGPYGSIVELLALTGQRREEVANSLGMKSNFPIEPGRFRHFAPKTASPTSCTSPRRPLLCWRAACRGWRTSFFRSRARTRFAALVPQNENSTSFPKSRAGGFTTSAAHASQAWPAFVFHRMLPTRFSTIRVGLSLAWLPYISGMSFF